MAYVEHGLTFEHGGHVVTVRDFVDQSFPRQRVDVGTLQTTAMGVPYVAGPPRPALIRFSVVAYITEAQRATLESLYSSWDAARAARALSGNNVQVWDGLPGGSVTPADGAFEAGPSYSKAGRLYVVGFGVRLL